MINLGKPYFKYELYQIWGKYALKKQNFQQRGSTIDPNLLSGKIGHPSCENPNEAPVMEVQSISLVA